MKKKKTKKNRIWLVILVIIALLFGKIPFNEEAKDVLYEREDTKDYPLNYDFSKITEDEYSFKVFNKENKEKESWKGIDVSVYQHDIDWAKVSKTGIDFAFLRLGYRGYTEGALFMDKNFIYNATEALENNIDIGVYFVTQALDEREAEEEARFVLDAIKGIKITWPVVIDAEENQAKEERSKNISSFQRTKNVKAFCKVIEDAGYVPMIYSNYHFIDKKLDIDELGDIPIWYASYSSTTRVPFDYQIWQYTDKGSIPGIDTDVDFNISFVNYKSR